MAEKTKAANMSAAEDGPVREERASIAESTSAAPTVPRAACNTSTRSPTGPQDSRLGRTIHERLVERKEGAWGRGEGRTRGWSDVAKVKALFVGREEETGGCVEPCAGGCAARSRRDLATSAGQ